MPSPLFAGLVPQGATSLCMGLCITGLLCTLIPGLTARRLNDVGSRSSSRRRLRVISNVEGGPCPDEGSCEFGCGVDAREGELEDETWDCVAWLRREAVWERLGVREEDGVD